MSQIRRFETGATRDTNEGKHEYFRCLDPLVLQRYAVYMSHHRIQSDGTAREPDNWKHGMTIASYKDSLGRHSFDAWLIHDYGIAVRPETGEEVDLEDALCGVIFNAMGWLFEVLRKRAGNGAVRGPIAGADVGQ